MILNPLPVTPELDIDIWLSSVAPHAEVSLLVLVFCCLSVCLPTCHRQAFFLIAPASFKCLKQMGL